MQIIDDFVAHLIAHFVFILTNIQGSEALEHPETETTPLPTPC